MKQVLIKQGRAVVEDIPAPLIEAGTVLVRVAYSCISSGTELSGIRSTGEALWKRALKNPGAVAKVLSMAATQGVRRTSSLVQGVLQAGQPTGYSAAGVVLEVGEGITDIEPGDRVACAGAQFAHHAEVIRVPRNLVVSVPEGLDMRQACTVTLGAIAMQGVRRASPTLGETFVVIGLGLLGQLTAQLLRSAGCRVVVTDLDADRLQLAGRLGADVVLDVDVPDVQQVVRLTDGIGADGVIITAATPSDSVVATAFHMCRKKGRVVLVGDVGLHLQRADIYEKELDFFISTSYGPGRYDHRYETQGLDYPVAYVRWTENRNLGEYLRQLAAGRVNVDALISAEYSLDDATAAYESLQRTDGPKPLIAVLKYPSESVVARKVANPSSSPSSREVLRIAVIGAGAFAAGMHLPNLRKLGDLYHIQAIVNRTGHKAVAAARQFGAKYSATDWREVLDDREVDAVLIATRHDTHAQIALEALKAGKHVLVEKPLAMTEPSLCEIEQFFAERQGQPTPVLLTGFNRRFSPCARRIADAIAQRSNPFIANYRMNAGHIPLDNWIHGPEGGGRNIGEACHIYDLFTYLSNSRVVDVHASAIKPATAYYGRNDNFVATLQFEDGSTASLTYSALGHSGHPKEQMELLVDGQVYDLQDYRKLTCHGTRAKGLSASLADKGHEAELKAFAASTRSGDWPIPLWQQVQATRIALRVEAMISTDGGR